MWFNSAPSDDVTDFMTAKIFGSGAYGTLQDKMNSEAVRTGNTGKNVKRKRLFTAIFPGLTGMRQKYPVLKKAPVLLPVMWVARWFEAIFKPSKIKEQKHRLDMLSDEGVSQFEKELHYVGLDFNFD